MQGGGDGYCMTANPNKRDPNDLIIIFLIASASSDFCRLLITFENSLDPYKGWIQFALHSDLAPERIF